MPEYIPRKNKENDYGFDPHEQEHKTYTGMGEDINVHDQWAVESMGPIQDRTNEHLGKSDKAITAYRRQLVKAIKDVEAGARPIMVLDAAAAKEIRGPIAIDGMSQGPWQQYPAQADAERRARASWANGQG
jgi:hypothetical protein